MQFRLAMVSRMPIKRSIGMPRLVSSLGTLGLRQQSLKLPVTRRAFGYPPQALQPSPANSTFTLLGAGGLMLSTYLILNHALNQHDESVSAGTKAVITPSVHNYLKGTYTYVAGGLAITAASAVGAFRSGVCTTNR
ncbi:hypothetical protein BVRB_026920 [Beta vulgaris subsp. vulgaris]|uniref:Uncharacterized protein n=1 Tax=Beta vulgaris subsp. vulgaris TaxID=3555 RepID=A0A0J8B1X7_BETVV|nr:hypothetical protein BVRB_026920 [Beta vulgaris subsp. vulgaris]